MFSPPGFLTLVDNSENANQRRKPTQIVIDSDYPEELTQDLNIQDPNSDYNKARGAYTVISQRKKYANFDSNVIHIDHLTLKMKALKNRKNNKIMIRPQIKR